MFRFDALGVIMAVYSMEDADFFLFRLDDVHFKWVCCERAQNNAKSLQLSHGMFGIGEFLCLCRLRYLGSQHMKKYEEGSINAFCRIQSVVKIPLLLLW